MDRLLVRVLGPVRFPGAGGAPVEPSGAMPRRLLAALALAGPEGRSVAGLTDDLWPDEPPRNPRGAVQMLVSRIRAAAEDGLLGSTPTGYRLAGSDLALAEAADADGALVALALWSGRPGADLYDDGLADELVARADRARIRLLRLAAERLLEEGRAQDAVPLLEELVAAAPLDGHPVALLMRALAGSGRTDAALAAFAAHRERLADALGADPHPEASRLNTELLRDGGAAAAGAELVGVRTATTPLLGRDEDVARLAAAVPEHRLTSIVGAGGLGKTRLAHEVAAAVAPRFGRVVFVELAGAREDADVAPVVGDAVGARVTQTRRRLGDPLPPDLATRTREALAARPTLLVLDNCEQVIEAVAALTAELLATVPTLTVLTTTRVPLLLPGERLHALQPLDAATDAVDLFLERAASARPGARLDPGTVARVCAHLDGLPLAIELAAARLRSMTLEELDRRLADRFAVLVGGDRTAPERHRTLFAVIDWSWQLLAHDRRRALRMLAVFPDGFAEEGASILLGADASGVLSDLVDQSLLTFAEGPDGRGRYRMLETVREFGLRALADAGETDAAHRGLDRFALAFCRRVHPGLTGGLDPAATRATDVEEETLLTALRAAPAGREAVVLAVFALLAEFWVYRGGFERIPEQLPLVLAVARHRPADGLEREEALRALTFAGVLGTATRAPGGLRALAHLRRVRRSLPAGADGFWPTFSGALLEPSTAADALPRLERLAASSPDPLTATFSALLIGQLHENGGQVRRAIADAARAQQLAERHGFTWFRLVATMNMAQLHSQRADRAEGLRLAFAATAEIAALDVRADLGQLDWIVGVNETALGRLDDAEARFTRLAANEPGAKGSDSSDNRTIGLAGLAEVAGARGDHAAAARSWAAAIRSADRASAPWRATVGAAALAATVRLAQPGPGSEAVDRAYRRLRYRVLALSRFPWDRLDVPVFASGTIGLAAALLAPGRTDEQRAIGAELVALAVPIGARLDFPSLDAVPGVAAALAADAGVPDRDEVLHRIVALLRTPAARL